jgi:hypothetical protein
MLYSVLAIPGPGLLLSFFCALMAGGEAIKLVWLRTTGFTVRDAAPMLVQGLVAGYALLYLVALAVWQIK